MFQVAIDPGIAAALGATTPQREALVFAAIEAGVRAWESPVLRFDIVIDSGVTVSPLSGFELDLIALDGSHPAFLGLQVFGLATWNGPYGVERTLTNGMQLTGDVISGADVYLNRTTMLMFASVFPDDTVWPSALTRLIMHEVGHALGLGHPNESYNWDTDLDPTNAMIIDPADPFGALFISPNRPTGAIMLNRPCGTELINCPPLYYTSLTPDEIGGRDALYPVPAPEPTVAALLVVAIGLVRVRRRISS